MKKLVFGLIAMVVMSSSAQVSNKSNPYDYAGKQHNEVVNEYLTKYGSQSLSNDKIIEHVNNICKNRGVEGRFLTVSDFVIGMTDIKNNFKETVDKSPLSKESKVELQKLLDYMLNGGYNGSISYEDCFNYILNFETNILNNKNISNSDKEFLLKATSVGRYSINLWYGKSEQSINARQGNRWIRWVIVGACDIAGGVAGGGAFSVASGAGASVLANETIDKVK